MALHEMKWKYHDMTKFIIELTSAIHIKEKIEISQNSVKMLIKSKMKTNSESIIDI